MRRTVPVITILTLASAAWGQQAVSARSGLIQYVEGKVLLADKEIAPKANEFVQVDKGQVLATQDGRAEVLLTPGAFLRLSEDSSFRMISGSLSDTRLEVLSGSAMVEVEELLKDNAITLQSGSTTISLKKHGLYRIDADHSVRFRVYDGEAVITSGERTMEAKKGHEVQLDQMLMAKFDTDVTDPFYRWSERRAGYVATANVSSARSVLGGSGYGSGLGYNTNIGYGGLGYGGFGYSNWVYNPWFGMYTFVPLSGFAYSPFGYAIYSPMTVRYVVVQPAVQTSYLGAVAQRTASPPTIRATSADAAPGSGRRGVGVAVGGSSGVGANPGGNGGGNSVANSGGGGGSVASRSSAPAAAPSAAPAAAPAAARSGGSAGARGR